MLFKNKWKLKIGMDAQESGEDKQFKNTFFKVNLK